MARYKKSGAGILKKIILVVISIAILGLTAFAGYSYYIGKRIKGNDVPAKKVDTKKPVNILVLGVDAGDYDSKSKDCPKRSDTMMLFRFFPETKKIYILSIPRDTKVKINGKTEKINSANLFGGTELAIKTVEDLLGVEINYYAKIDYEGFKECIDAIGGVDIVVPHNMDYDAYDIHIHFKKGQTVHLDGTKAEEFVRWRKNNNGTGYAMGDLGRESTQQEFMIKVLEKVKSPAGMLRLPALVTTLSKYVKTNMDEGEMLSYGLKLNGINTANVQKKILAGEPKYIGKISYFVPDVDKDNEYLSHFRNDTDTASNTGTSTDTGSTPNADRSNIKVIVLNSTGKNGLAAEYKKQLESLGYNVTETGNYSKVKYKNTKIIDYESDGYGDLINKDLNTGSVTHKDKAQYDADVVIILGKDAIK